jgi:hypothetical protein
MLASLRHYFPTIAQADLQLAATQIAALTALYLDHRFDLLGSGWVQVRYGMACAGVEGFCYGPDTPVQSDVDGHWLKGRINLANLAESQRIWELVDSTYVPIDWQLDFKSGHRWRENTWYQNIRFGDIPGVDIKVPWELARSQHLVQLAWAYGLTTADASVESGFQPASVYAREFRNQVLDFISTNPPRFGVNWYCAMDVAIRVANWLTAYDLFRAYGMTFDEPFVTVFNRSIYQHGEHIIANLEWNPQWRSNHYLADIVGLLFVAAYLPRTAQVDFWLAFAIRELRFELKAQFNADGGNFEGSSSYHRLSAEMIVYSAALILGLPAEKRAALQEYDHRLYKVPRPLPPAPLDADLATFPAQAEYAALIEKMAEFTIHLSKPSGHVPQIGDNDNGRFLKLHPSYALLTPDQARARYANLTQDSQYPPANAPYWDEDMLDHRHLVAAINGLFGRSDFCIFAGDTCALETQIVKELSQGSVLPSYRKGVSAAETIQIGADWAAISKPLLVNPNQNRLEIPVTGGGLLAEFSTYGYPDFGLYIFRSRRLYLAVRCGQIGQRGSGGHDHNDQLAIELVIDGEDWITDPGTYLYTPLPAWRNKYRSVRAHFAPQPTVLTELSLDAGLFYLHKPVAGKCLYFGKAGFIGEYRGYRSPVYRIITFNDECIMIDDITEGDLHLRRFSQARWPEGLAVSSKYGSNGP